MPKARNNHGCPVCKKEGSSGKASKSDNGGVCKEHQVKCKSVKHKHSFVHLKDEDCIQCLAYDEAQERNQKKAEEDAKKAEEKKKKKNEFKE
ncbi:hypothetical protein KC315_g10595 [Hortaea werneckii]|nr:hypothetical protein KC315_g10595 [Hortaea werneckii]KAI7346147.1 hypothetical protein KC354_g14373 [Hortaea werneckii]